MRRGNFSGVCTVCLSVCMYVCNAITIESLDVQCSLFGLRGYLEGIRVMFVYEGHRVKVKVTAAESAKFHIRTM